MEGHKPETEYTEIDNVLLQKAAGGDMDAFGRLIINYERFIYNLAYRMLPNAEDACDIAQEVLIKIYKNLSKCTDVKMLKPWISKIATNTCIDELRKRKRKLFVSLDRDIEAEEGSIGREFESDAKTPEQMFIHKEEWEDALAALHKLPEDSKMLIILRDIQGFSYSEICGATGVNMGTLKSKISRARSTMRNHLNRLERGAAK